MTHFEGFDAFADFGFDGILQFVNENVPEAFQREAFKTFKRIQMNPKIEIAFPYSEAISIFIGELEEEVVFEAEPEGLYLSRFSTVWIFSKFKGSTVQGRIPWESIVTLPRTFDKLF